jgi:aryl-alcohol dehydrogenase-like predicted oxidoreductase
VEHRRLGSTAASVGVLGLGTHTWSHGTDVAEATGLVRSLLDVGGDVVDVDVRRTEPEFLGRVLEDEALSRGVFLAIRATCCPSRRDLLADLDMALSQSRRDHADVFLAEGWDESLPWEETASALAVAVSTGRARYVGVSTRKPWQAAILGTALALHPQRSPLAAIQSRLSLLDRVHEADLRAVAGAVGAGVIAAAPLAGGVLTGKYRHSTPADSRGAGEREGAQLQHYRSAWSRPVVDGLVAAGDGLGLTPAAVAMSWVLGRPGIATAVLGARTVHQWRAALTHLDLRLPIEITAALDEVSDAATTAPSNPGERGRMVAPVSEGR